MEDFLALAKRYVEKEVGDDFVIVPKSVLDLDFFCFTYQTKKFLETNDFNQMAHYQAK